MAIDAKEMKTYTLRVEAALLEKFHRVADFEDRSVNGQIVALMRRNVASHEAKYGEIVLPPKPSNHKSGS